MRKPLSIALLASAALATTHAGATAASATKTSAKKTTTTAHTYVGPSEDMRWGPVQVTIVVKGTVVTSLSATAPTERARSAFINQQAVPMLRKEVLQAKTAAKIKNIYGISGATMTSQAFYQSLLAALHQAKLA
ncbi:MAG TPA: FMN-binding protein [Chloroflexota bacterium]|nr:FMN-binding protein [Chloroflexota bacterium]